MIRFEGRWEACSVFDAVEAPLGEEVFGGKPVLKAAEKDLTSKLSYPVLFKTLNTEQAAIVASTTGITNKVISDRLYNVEQIALASMGPNSIIDDVQKVFVSHISRFLAVVFILCTLSFIVVVIWITFFYVHSYREGCNRLECVAFSN